MGSYAQEDDLDEYEDDFIDDDDGGVGVGVGMKRYRDERVDEEEQDEEDEYEEEEVEEERVSEEAMKLLKYREKLKEQFRSKLRQENGGILGKSLGDARRPPLSNFGSFFGPSQPVIADRVAQESKALLETRHLAPKAPKPSTTSQKNGKVSSPSISGSKNGVSRQPLASQVKSKAQIMKQTRDYSFLLSDDADVPKPNKDNGIPKNLVSRPDSRPAQVPAQRNTPSGRPGSKVVNGREQQRKPHGTLQVCSTRTAPVRKFTSDRTDNRSSAISSDSRKQLDSRKQPQPTRQVGSGTGSGLVRPPSAKALPPKKPGLSTERKIPLEKKASVASARYRDRVPSASNQNVRNGQRPSIEKSRAPGVIRPQERTMNVQHSRDRVLKENAMTSNAQVRQQAKQSSIQGNFDRDRARVQKKPNGQASAHSQSGGLKKDANMRKRRFDEIDDDDDADPLAMIRQMFRYDRSKYIDDDDDGKSMEADFNTIRMEEKRSARIAKKEDEEEFAKNEEEERQEKLRKKAKMRKLSQR